MTCECCSSNDDELRAKISKICEYQYGPFRTSQIMEALESNESNWSKPLEIRVARQLYELGFVKSWAQNGRETYWGNDALFAVERAAS